MAELDVSAKGKAPKRKTVRIDMTAMVDVAFLLLTFFVLTSTMTKETMMVFAQSPESGTIDLGRDKFLTLVALNKGKCGYYFGDGSAGFHQFNGEGREIRRMIFFHLKGNGLPRCKKGESQNCWDPIIVIKSQPGSKYGQMVSLMDEVRISGSPKYAFGDWTPEDSALVANHEIHE